MALRSSSARSATPRLPRKLEVTVVQGRNFHPHETGATGSSALSPFVQLTLSEPFSRCSTTDKTGEAPVWDETFTFSTTTEHTLLYVCVLNAAKREPALGKYTIDIARLIERDLLVPGGEAYSPWLSLLAPAATDPSALNAGEKISWVAPPHGPQLLLRVKLDGNMLTNRSHLRCGGHKFLEVQVLGAEKAPQTKRLLRLEVRVGKLMRRVFVENTANVEPGQAASLFFPVLDEANDKLATALTEEDKATQQEAQSPSTQSRAGKLVFDLHSLPLNRRVTVTSPVYFQRDSATWETDGSVLRLVLKAHNFGKMSRDAAIGSIQAFARAYLSGRRCSALRSALLGKKEIHATAKLVPSSGKIFAPLLQQQELQIRIGLTEYEAAAREDELRRFTTKLPSSPLSPRSPIHRSPPVTPERSVDRIPNLETAARLCIAQEERAQRNELEFDARVATEQNLTLRTLAKQGSSLVTHESRERNLLAEAADGSFSVLLHEERAARLALVEKGQLQRLLQLRQSHSPEKLAGIATLLEAEGVARSAIQWDADCALLDLRTGFKWDIQRERRSIELAALQLLQRLQEEEGTARDALAEQFLLISLRIAQANDDRERRAASRRREEQRRQVEIQRLTQRLGNERSELQEEEGLARKALEWEEEAIWEALVHQARWECGLHRRSMEDRAIRGYTELLRQAELEWDALVDECRVGALGLADSVAQRQRERDKMGRWRENFGNLVADNLVHEVRERTKLAWEEERERDAIWYQCRKEHTGTLTQLQRKGLQLGSGNLDLSQSGASSPVSISAVVPKVRSPQKDRQIPRRLAVRVTSVSEIPATIDNPASFVRLRLDGSSSTSSVVSGYRPVWNEEFSFVLTDPVRQTLDVTLVNLTENEQASEIGKFRLVLNDLHMGVRSVRLLALQAKNRSGEWQPLRPSCTLHVVLALSPLSEAQQLQQASPPIDENGFQQLLTLMDDTRTAVYWEEQRRRRPIEYQKDIERTYASHNPKKKFTSASASGTDSDPLSPSSAARYTPRPPRPTPTQPMSKNMILPFGNSKTKAHVDWVDLLQQQFHELQEQDASWAPVQVNLAKSKRRNL